MNPYKSIGRAEIAFVRITLPFAAGIICVYSIQQQIISFLSAIVSILLGLLLFTRWHYLRHKMYRSKGIYGLAIFFLFIFLGGLASTLHKNKLAIDYQNNIRPEYFKVHIINEPQIKHDILKCQVQISQSYNMSGRTLSQPSARLLMRIKWKDQSFPSLHYGDQLIIPARAAPIQPALNPAAFDYRS